MSERDLDIERILHGTLFGEAVENGEVAALLADDRGFYIAANERACTLTGYSRDQLTRFRAGELSADEQSRRIYNKMLGRGRLQGRKQIRHRDGSVVPCRYWGIRTTVSRLSYVLLLIWPATSTSANQASLLARFDTIGEAKSRMPKHSEKPAEDPDEFEQLPEHEPQTAPEPETLPEELDMTVPEPDIRPGGARPSLG